MRITIVSILLLIAVAIACAAPSPSSPKNRPYTGIGILLLHHTSEVSDEQAEPPLHLYEEPSISRLGDLKFTNVPRYEWIFGLDSMTAPLVVLARKGTWLRVVYDDAGREAWLNPLRRGVFQTWDTFFKGKTVKLLPGLNKKYYQLFQQPGKGSLSVVTTKQTFKVVKLDNDWLMVMPDQNNLGWLRWRDEDGRLLLGVNDLQALQKR